MRKRNENLLAPQPCVAALALVIAMLAGGCAAMMPGNVKAVAPHSDGPRAGNVYLLRGFIGIFSAGIDDLSNQLNEHGVNAMVFQDDQWTTLANTLRKRYADAPQSEPLVLIGHSYGADDVVRIARELNRDNITVDLLVTLDPVTPPSVSPNVKHCVNIYQTNGVWDKLPWLRGVPLQADEHAATSLANYNIRTDRTDLLEPRIDHFNIEKKKKIQQEVMRHVDRACPPREEWALRQMQPAPDLTEAAEQAAYQPAPRAPEKQPSPPDKSRQNRPMASSSAPPVASGEGN